VEAMPADFGPEVPDLSGRGAGRDRGSPDRISRVRRAGVWLIWWVLMMMFWIILDDSLATDELLAGAAAAALAATLAELAGYQAATRPRMRFKWLGPALRLPVDLAADTWTVFAALWRQLARGQQPPSGFREVAVRFGGQSMEAKTRRALLVAGKSVAPNTFVLGLDAERDVMVVHQLVVTKETGSP
jgi:multisubunit Na+/H+ antiporter MnhE subunit